MSGPRVLVAMSGGVDSSVAAALAVEAGWDVTGVHLKLADTPAHLQVQGKGCCTLADADDARRVAGTLGIPFYVWDMAEEFRRAVVDDFADEYAGGRTPNPCARCNERVKVVGLLARARTLGFDALATGHYARVQGGRLYRAADRAKDQSYVLYMLGPAELDHLRLPLGRMTKPEVRATAARLGLRTAAKPESFDVCFVPDGDTAGWLERRLGRRPGQVVDMDGHVLGGHQGAYRWWWGSGPSWPSGRSSWSGLPPPTGAGSGPATPGCACAPTARRPAASWSRSATTGPASTSTSRSPPSPPARRPCSTTATWSSAAAPWPPPCPPRPRSPVSVRHQRSKPERPLVVPARLQHPGASEVETTGTSRFSPGSGSPPA